ncbi:hypothetical protein AB0B66_13835 [Catellatospora sp. NPDC049111]|uniref:COG4315 family predicted lipoprotein n=1 Tax=Catellatospora sp. NPDC049111 TaxID=3155271 RepID=UPI00340BAE9C
MGSTKSTGPRRAVIALAFLAAALVAPAAARAESGVTGHRMTALAAEQVTVQTKQGPMGTYLTDGQGRSLYLFAADTAGTSTCEGTCAAAWPPLVTTGAPQAGSGVSADKLKTVARPDGSMQVVYDNHPLYYFVKDAKAGDTNGQGLDAFGALWWLVAPAGSAITTR